jgi:hypothetical protein
MIPTRAKALPRVATYPTDLSRLLAGKEVDKEGKI